MFAAVIVQCDKEYLSKEKIETIFFKAYKWCARYVWIYSGLSMYDFSTFFMDAY